MSEHYDFHYQPTGSGAISGQQVLQQTEDAINELGDYVMFLDGGAMDVAQQALETAQNAEQDAQTALDTANSFSGAIQSAQQDASTALSAVQTAQTTASNAYNTANQASQDANTAVTTANNASGQVSTLSGTVTALGQRVTTAEGNIGQNTSDITALTTRVGTAEGNITTLQNDVSVAMGNASSAMATAGTVKQQAYVLRYSSSSVTDNSTIAYSTLDNTDNLKVGDKVIDSSGVIYSVTAIDTANSTFTIGTSLIDLAQDSDVVHKSGNETVAGYKTFSDNMTLYNSRASGNPIALFLKNQKVVMGSTTDIGSQNISFRDSADTNLTILKASCESVGNTSFEIRTYNKDSNNQIVSGGMLISQTPVNTYIIPTTDNAVLFGSSGRRWKSVYATNYYYGNDNVEFSTKFVTSDTAQTITYPKTFTTTQSFTGYPSIRLYIPTDDVNVLPSAPEQREIRFTDKNNVPIAYFVFQHRNDTNEPFRTCWRQLRLDGTSGYYSVNFNNLGEFYPEHNNRIKLGTSTNHWKDVQTNLVNGLTPSSLSLPSGNVSDFIDISSYFSNTGSGDANSYTASANGWIYLRLGDITSCQVVLNDSSNRRLWGTSATGNVEQIIMPILKNTTLTTTWVTNSTVNVATARFIPCQGNV